MKKHLLVLSLVLLPLYVIPAKERFIYKHISQNEGLTYTVNSIYKELDGDVWIGSPNGLYRFNGSYLHHYDDSLFNGLTILRTQSDTKGNFWVLTNSKLICRKTGQDTFTSVLAEGRFPGGPFHSICCNEDNVWFGSKGKIYIYRHSDETLNVLCDLKERPDFLCRNIDVIDGTTLLCSSHNGMLLIDTETGEVTEAPYGTRKEISCSFIDSRNRIWVALYNNGIEVYDKSGVMLKKYNTRNSDLSNDVVLCMTERDSVMWVGTDGGGINVIEPESDVIKVLSKVSGDPSSFPAHSIKSIYTDHSGNIWAGSIRDGLIRISSSKMKTYLDVHTGQNNGLSSPTVLCLYQDPDDRSIWIGTEGGGLNLFDPETSEFVHFDSTLRKKIVSIAKYSSHELMLSVYDDGIWVFDKLTGGMRRLHINDQLLNYQLKYAGRSMNLVNETGGNILLIGNVVKRFDKTDGSCTIINRKDIQKARGNYLPICTTEDGMWLHDYHSICFIPKGDDIIEEKAKCDDFTIKSGHSDADGIIWLATTAGLYRFDPESYILSRIRTSLFTEAEVVVCDRNSNVWIGTSRHLYAYITDSGTFTLFGDSDGAAPNEYLCKPRLLSSDGDVYIGGVRGLLHIDSSFSIDTEENPSIHLYGFAVDNSVVKAASGHPYEIPRNSKTAEISISVQEKDIFREKVYRFKIGDMEVIETDIPKLFIRQMPPPGTYDVLVSCSKRNGEWSMPAKVMTMKIPQPWYLTWWFITCILVFISLIVSAIAYMRAQRRKNSLRIAMKEQEQKVYEEKVKMLINISHELRTPLTLIMAPLKRLLGNPGTDDRHNAILSRIYRQSRRMKDLLNMVLDLRKMETGNTRLKIESLDFNKWVVETTSDITNEEKEAGINIITELDPEIGYVDFDRQKCDTVMTNILMNAIKHSNQGDTITLKTELREDMVRITTSDQGPGLRDTDMSRLFTRFYQNNHEQYGSGIGLSFSKILVELHDGRIGAGNNADKGAYFWWEIPVIRSGKEIQEHIPARAYLNELLGHESVSESDTDKENCFNTSDMSLMIVDDSLDLLEFLKEALCTEFSEVIMATSGNMAMKIMNSGKLPDIIVSDINMPDGDGFKLCQDLKANEKFSHIPIVLLTARGEEQSQSASYRVGADAFLSKPFETETLMELLRGILRRKTEIRKKYLDNDTEEGYTSSDESMIIQLNRIISEHIDNPDLDQKIICRELGMSRASLYNKMKAISGMGVKEYITKIRIEKAKSMIETSDRSMTEISEMTGFSGLSYFSTAFKNYTGMTPSQYKKQSKANQEK